MMKVQMKVLISALGLSLAVLLLIGNIFAWFAMSDNVSSDGVGLGLTAGEDQPDGSINIELETQLATQEIVRPDGTLEAKITLTNIQDTPQTVKLKIEQFTVSYNSDIMTELGDGSNYDKYKKYIDTDMYYSVDPSSGEATDNKLDITDLATDLDRQTFFRGFVLPSSNAFYYGIFNAENGDIDAVATKNYLSNESNATTAQLTSTSGVPITSTRLPIFEGASVTYSDTFQIPVGVSFNVSNNGSPSGTVTSTADGIPLEANQSVVFNMVFKFDPAKYCRYVYDNGTPDDATDDITYELQNSNPYLWQRISLVLGAEFTPTTP